MTLTENQVLALGMQKIMQKQAAQNLVLLKVAEVVEEATEKVDSVVKEQIVVETPEVPEGAVEDNLDARTKAIREAFAAFKI